ncbi:phosphoenolpyruvate carboxylase, partial [Cupriavidus sp. 8B]
MMKQAARPAGRRKPTASRADAPDTAVASASIPATAPSAKTTRTRRATAAKPEAALAAAPASAPARRASDKDVPLREDIRFLGRLLGDCVREQEGEAAFEVVETIRQTAVRFRRENDRAAGAELDRLLKRLSRDQTNSVVRAFSYFSHLANIAEDQHHNRRRRVHALAGSPP